MAAVGQAQEAENLVVNGSGSGEEVPAVDDVDAVAPEETFQVLKLVSVVAAGPVGVEPVIAAWNALGLRCADPHGRFALK